jgi:hypothetical protein
MAFQCRSQRHERGGHATGKVNATFARPSARSSAQIVPPLPFDETLRDTAFWPRRTHEQRSSYGGACPSDIHSIGWHGGR